MNNRTDNAAMLRRFRAAGLTREKVLARIPGTPFPKRIGIPVGRRNRFKAHNCRVIDTREAMAFNESGKLEFRKNWGGIKQLETTRKLPNGRYRKAVIT